MKLRFWYSSCFPHSLHTTNRNSFLSMKGKRKWPETNKLLIISFNVYTNLNIADLQIHALNETWIQVVPKRQIYSLNIDTLLYPYRRVRLSSRIIFLTCWYSWNACNIFSRYLDLRDKLKLCRIISFVKGGCLHYQWCMDLHSFLNLSYDSLVLIDQMCKLNF